ncbi:MAG TPA: AarF/UbiB family protein [Gemmatimonadaceae bacterium]|nr:AarF/UbiB family protein [Gemmatimonadaceae bacterium]
MHTLSVLFALGPFAVSFIRDFRRWLWFGEKVPRTPEFHQRRAKRLVETIIRLGPTFVKMAQVFAARADLIPEPYISQLGRLVDQVSPLAFDDVAKTIREAYGRDVDEVFLDFDRKPLAAASLGQVHRARVPGTGYGVAVKVLRPRVEQRVAADLRAGKRILRWVAARWKHPEIARIRSVVAEFEVRISEEMDFRLEAEYATEIGKNFEGNRNVIVPRIVHELTRQRVLVMEYVEGMRIDRLDRAHVDVSRVVATLVELYVQMCFVDGLFHADPHPGNLMVAPDGRIVLVDFGMTVRVPVETRRALLRTALAAVRRDPTGVANGFDDLGLVPPGTDFSHVQWLADLLITNAYARKTLQDRIDTLLADQVMKTLFNSPIVLPQHLVYFGRTAALIEGIGARYDRYFQVIPVASPVILRMRGRILQSLGEHVEPQLEDLLQAAGFALGKAARWVMDRVPR